MTRREPYVDLWDTTVSLWEAGDGKGCQTAFWRDLTRRAFQPLVRMMRQRGWRVTADPEIVQRYRALRPYHRRATKGDLVATLNVSGRVVKVEIWQERHGITHPSGARYEHYKRRLMPPSLRRACDLEMDKIAAVLATISGPDRSPIVDRRRLDEETADQKIARAYRESWHTDPALGRPPFTMPSSNRSAEGVGLVHGQTVWCRSRSGRWQRGQAFYSLNSRWFVRLSRTSLEHYDASELHQLPPTDPRKKRSPRRAARLTALIKAAVVREDYLRAHILRCVRDGDAPPFRRAS